jgi:hypothetical protein
MSSLAVRFPEEWATLSVRDRGQEEVRELVAGLAVVGPEAQAAADAFFGAVLPLLEGWGISAFASLALPDEESGGLVQAMCAIAVVSSATDATDLRAIAESGPHPGLERETSTVQLPLGPAIRSSAIRFVEELLDADGIAPYALEVRFVVPLSSDRVGVLHFETMSLVFLEELERQFDAIAGTTRIT